MRSTGDLERGAADAIGPIVERTLKELRLGPEQAGLLRRRIAEAYMRGRTDGIDVFPPHANHALSAEGIAVALGRHDRPLTPPLSAIGNEASGVCEGLHWLDLEHPPARGVLGAPERPAGTEANEQKALEVMGNGRDYTVTVEVAVDWDDTARLTELLAVLDARPEPLGRLERAHVRGRAIGVTFTVKARSEKVAQEIATVALIDEMAKLGLV